MKTTIKKERLRDECIMNNWKIHTPEGVQDTLFEECQLKRKIENALMETFRLRGYFEIETPIYEYYDVFDGLDGIGQENLINFFDRDGRILSLRAEFTTPISRVVSTKFDSGELPLKISYLGNAFRYEDVMKGMRQREFTQAGIELVGDSSAEADAEVIASVIRGINAAGVKDIKIDIGQIMIFKGLVEEAGLTREESETAQSFINAKNSYMLADFLNQRDMKPDTRELLIRLPDLFGDISIIDELLDMNINQTSKVGLVNLKAVVEILCDYGYADNISIDLGLLQSIKYYTGIIFKGFTYGVGFPICGGGRYDTLSRRFGKEISATGCGISVSRLLSKRLFKEEIEKCVCGAVVFFDSGSRKEADFVCEALRGQGMSAEMRLTKGREADMAYGQRKKIENILFAAGQEIEIHSLKKGTVTKTTLKELSEE